jgi:hypothetical protein
MLTNIINAEIPAEAIQQIKIAAIIASDLSKGIHPEDELLAQVNAETMKVIVDDIKRIQNG